MKIPRANPVPLSNNKAPSKSSNDGASVHFNCDPGGIRTHIFRTGI
jgi:hypothetical protein